MKKSTLYDLANAYTQRTDRPYTTADLDRGLMLAEARIGRDLRTKWNWTYGTIYASPLGGTSLANLPTDYRAVTEIFEMYGSQRLYRLVDPKTHQSWVLEDRRPSAIVFNSQTGPLRLFLSPEVTLAPGSPSETAYEAQKLANTFSEITADANSPPAALIPRLIAAGAQAHGFLATSKDVNLGIYYYHQPAALTETEDPWHPAAVFPDVYVHGLLMETARLKADVAAKEDAMAEYAAALDLANLGTEEQETDRGAAEPEPFAVIGG